MKTKVVYLATKAMVAIVFVAILAFKALAGEAPKLKVVPHSADKALIAIDNLSDDAAVLTIEDERGDILYYKEGNINKDFYTKIFSFKNIEDGDYVIKVKNKSGENSVNFSVEGETIKLKEPSSAPFVSIENGTIRLSHLNNSLSNVYISLIGKDGEFYKRNLGKDFSITAGLNISNLEEGEYELRLTNGENNYSYNFKK
jgi:hypothetical protein